MTEFMGPPLSWYDPPEGHKDACNCSRCHSEHVESGEFADLAGSPDYFCCKDELDRLIDQGEWCLIHGNLYMEEKICLECEAQAALQIPMRRMARG